MLDEKSKHQFLLWRGKSSSFSDELQLCVSLVILSDSGGGGGDKRPEDVLSVSLNFSPACSCLLSSFIGISLIKKKPPEAVYVLSQCQYMN